ncbi:MAG: hypothetical protein KKC85_17180 [Gammaproteobacteria bacterium]|nr:hypothetical protein [Gammaproteobacteria bacterium]MBU1441820.1 hypothetical protein [Gammaproteobacteria bacterium]MBU2288149.1 hypothetical protein [Gammaproteobacteria bacterium]
MSKSMTAHGRVTHLRHRLFRFASLLSLVGGCALAALSPVAHGFTHGSDGSVQFIAQIDVGKVRDGTAGPAAASADGCPAGTVKVLPPLRQAYVDAVSDLSAVAAALKTTRADSETIARAMHARRRAIGEQFKTLTPPDLRIEIEKRNRQKYRDELGPSVEWLRAQGRSWDQITESASRAGGQDLGFQRC